MEHVGVSGVQLSVGAEMKAYVNQVAAASNQFFCKFRKEPRQRSLAFFS